MSNNLHVDLEKVKSKLEVIELEFEQKLVDMEKKSENIITLDNRIKNLSDQEKNSIVTIQVGSKSFKTKLSTLLKGKDSIFYKFTADSIKENKPIKKDFFFDRHNYFFSMILDYLRTDEMDVSGLNKIKFAELKDDLEYYGIYGALDNMEKFVKEITIVSFFGSPKYSSCPYSVKGIDDKLGNKGVCVGSPYHLTFELSASVEVTHIDIMGYKGNSSIWGSTNGSGASILISEDKETGFTKIGTIPSTFGNNISRVKFTNVKPGKYLKFTHTTYLGIGYLKINPE